MEFRFPVGLRMTLGGSAPCGQPSFGRPLTVRLGARLVLGLGGGLLVLLAPAGLSSQTPAELPGPVLEADRPEGDRTVVSPPAARVPTPEELGLVPGRPRVTPTRTDSPPEIDGVLDDEAWATAANITEFTQQSPIEGAPATEATDVYIAYDSEKVYFGFHVRYRDPSIMRANRVERDRAMQDDLMTVYFDTFLDQQRGYEFDVNGYGVQGEGIISSGGGGGGRFGGGGGGQGIPRADRSWDVLFETAGQIVEDGYVTEMAIPFKSLRYPSPPEDEPHRWGFQIVREVKGNDQENQVWAPMSRYERSFFAQMGLLEGMTDISTSRNLEILPTFTAIQYGEIDPTVPGFVNQDTDPDAGVNVKYGLTSDLTADFTINPDFSQIESDRPQIEVNQRFPLLFRELRPFFVEGAEIFQIAAPVTFVHTRTIVDPDYGAKLSGQVGRFAIGMLTANDVAPGRVDDTADPAFNTTAQTFIARARYDLYAESNVGAIFTDREFLDSHSRVFGADGNFRLSPTISGDFRAVGSRYKGLGEDEVSGHMLATRISQNSNHLRWSVVANQISPDFATDVGFVRRTDTRTVGSELGYRFRPESWIINWGPSVNYRQTYDYDGILQDENVSLRLNFNFARNISVFSNTNRDMERFGGVNFHKDRFFVRANANTSRSYSFGADFSTGDQIYYLGPFLGHQVGWGVDATLRPLDRLQARLGLEGRRLTDPANNDSEVFNIRIFRATTTFQFTDRLGVRNITEVNSQDHTFDLNILFNYRVNAGTVFYLGYDDHFQQADLIEGDRNGDEIEEQLFFTTGKRRTNRALFVKMQYLLRY